MKKKKKGFTLVELVVVIAVIGILISIVFPRFQMATTRAKDGAALTSIGTLRKAASMYFAENNDSFTDEYPGNLKISHIQTLIDAQYLDLKSRNIFDSNVNGYNGTNSKENITVEVGSMVSETDCGTIPQKGYIPLKLGNDGVSIIIDSETYNSNCIIWKDN